jgi:hypothetical protein
LSPVTRAVVTQRVSESAAAAASAFFQLKVRSLRSSRQETIYKAVRISLKRLLAVRTAAKTENITIIFYLDCGLERYLAQTCRANCLYEVAAWLSEPYVRRFRAVDEKPGRIFGGGFTAHQDVGVAELLKSDRGTSWCLRVLIDQNLVSH